MSAKIVYPATPPVPGAPALGQIASGSLGGRTEYFKLTYVTPEGESLPSAESVLAISANNVAQIAPPAYPRPFAIYGYNVYGGSATGAEVLQTATPVLAGQIWTEPAGGLLTATAVPPTSWTAATLTFGQYAYPTDIPFDDRVPVVHQNVSAAGLLEEIYEHTDQYMDFNVEYAAGADIAAWQTFVKFAERGGIFTYYPAKTAGDLSPGLGTGTNYTLWGKPWRAAFKSAGFYTFKMVWRLAIGM